MESTDDLQTINHEEKKFNLALFASSFDEFFFQKNLIRLFFS